MSSNWTDRETKALLFIRTNEKICRQITGTVSDSVIYDKITSLLRERGIHRTKSQVISKLKTLRIKFLKIRELQKKSGNERLPWAYFELCQSIWGTSRPSNPEALNSSLNPEEPQTSSVEDGRDESTSTDIETPTCDVEKTDYVTEVITPPPRKKAKKGHISGFIREQEPLHIPEQREYEELLRREAREEQKEERESLMAMWKEMMEFQGNLLKEFIHRPSLPSSHPPYHKHGHYNQGSSFPSTSYLAPYHSPGAETEIESAISQEEEEEEEEKYVIPATIPLISDTQPVNCANDSQSNLTVTLSPPPTQSAEKTDLELSVLRRQERVLQLQEEYYSLKIQHLKAKMAMEPTQKHKEAWQIQQVS
ncbi:uncharacterized protein LOC127445957 isoform X2 [Myxocyprinus asiaticus]|uniref:uncharacterized protein LOC127445957 isoform X2 n=1 Tax=Myxocyprinus asiaticus TaxID=70543 RepID=UPI0022228D50|nr:uncharacterized protein LOC127445957 isoform X2 [Myxocyprinus asiaticus]